MTLLEFLNSKLKVNYIDVILDEIVQFKTLRQVGQDSIAVVFVEHAIRTGAFLDGETRLPNINPDEICR